MLAAGGAARVRSRARPPPNTVLRGTKRFRAAANPFRAPRWVRVRTFVCDSPIDVYTRADGSGASVRAGADGAGGRLVEPEHHAELRDVEGLAPLPRPPRLRHPRARAGENARVHARESACTHGLACTRT